MLNCNACGNFIVVTKLEILVISLTDFFDAASLRHNDVIPLPPNFLATSSKQPRSQSWRLRDVGCHAASCLPQIHSLGELKQRLIDVWCGPEQSIFDEAINQWRERHRVCVHAKAGHIEYSLWSNNVDFVHSFYIQCDLFDCYIFNYEIMPAPLANTFLFILQCTSRFEVWW